jgi:thiamine pyrophosphate-dependent acetolactate synthase large subunit-like protein
MATDKHLEDAVAKLREDLDDLDDLVRGDGGRTANSVHDRLRVVESRHGLKGVVVQTVGYVIAAAIGIGGAQLLNRAPTPSAAHTPAAGGPP